MRPIVVGGRTFAVAVADALWEDEHDVCAVWCEEDDKLQQWAHRKELPAFHDPSAEWLRRMQADLLVSVHNFKYIGREALRATRLGAIGYHPSLLPAFKGKDSVRDAVEAGAAVTGGSVYWLDEGLDTGPVAMQEAVSVRGRDASTLWRETLFPLGVELVRFVVGKLDAGERMSRVEIPECDKIVREWPYLKSDSR